MFDFGGGLAVYLNRLVPLALREKQVTDYIEYVRIRALSVMLLLMFVLSIPGAISVLIRYLDSTPDSLLADWSGMLVLLIYGVQILLFYKFNNYWLSALAFTSFYFLVVVIFVVMTGGHESPMKMLLLTCPFVSFMIGGKHEGIQTSVLVTAIGLVLAFLQSINFEPPNIFSDTDEHMIFFMDWIIAVIVIIFSLMVYETALQRSKALITPSVSGGTGDPVVANLDRFLHRLVPPALQASLPVHSIPYIRARFLSFLLFSLTILGISTIFPMIAAFWWFDIDPASMLLQNLISVAMLSIFVLQLWFFYRFGNQELSSLLFANSYFLVIMAMVMSSGGYDSPLKYFLLTCPLIAFVIGGIREGIQNALFTIIAGMALVVFKMRGFEIPDIYLHFSYYYLIFSTNWIVTLGVIVTSIIVYETELQR